ncbi:FAD/NAD(P)-binding protein [Aquimarina sp. U1-2]|uniref:FAD/NAD(P)-binding protein n=1 Tax=Aquimarina sp. U1-2 TaxID=2823141 RepID=UPI001AEC9F2B|nr:FAD/NAD(P)-binding protein [Aquimarina sp. U1-2]MBP2832003.1 FAD/NAD(P)-binding protein [Aquimarina sp. U1-2]
MRAKTKINASNIIFIGSGISSSFTIIHFLDHLLKIRIQKELKLTIIDKYKEFHTGIPYGERSGSSVLLITSLKNFLPLSILQDFLIWLTIHKDSLIQEFRSNGGKLANEWIETNTNSIKHNKWEELYIPRRFFGRYIDELVRSKINESISKGIIAVDYIMKEVIDVEKTNRKYTIFLNSGETIYSEKVILSIGSLPVKYLWKHQSCIEEEHLLFINNPYCPDLSTVLNKINTFIKNKENQNINVLIVGANASGLEMLYKLNDVKEIESEINKFLMLSIQGLLPDTIINEEKRKKYKPHYLEALKKESHITAKLIADATFKDLDRADQINLGAASTVEIVSKAFGSLLERLDETELKEFACLYGNKIGRRQRCAGYHYFRTAQNLHNQNKFQHIAGRFENITQNSKNDYLLEYLDTCTNTNRIHDDTIQIVINCIGSTTLYNDDIPQLLKNLMNKGFCVKNNSNIGFDVNEKLEAQDNFHIIGPLVAGNIIEGKAVWHLEHCGRIIWLSKLLAEKMGQYFSQKQEVINE